MKTGNIILDVTQGLDVELGLMRWATVKRIVEKHIAEARKELLRTAMEERKLLLKNDLVANELAETIRVTEDRRKETRGANSVAFERI